MFMRFRSTLIALALLPCAASVQADSGNTWRVNGAIGGRTLVLDCNLVQSSGSCVDAAPGSKAKRLTSLSTSGDRASWSFQTRHLFMNITLSFNGRIAGDRMSGTMSAAGRSGTFTAERR
jgi:hypothetical protein